MPTEDELARWQRVRSTMNEILQGKGLVHLADDAIHVTAMKGPLERGWQEKVDAFAARITSRADEPAVGAARWYATRPRRARQSASAGGGSPDADSDRCERRTRDHHVQ